jgi:hypothetical protein
VGQKEKKGNSKEGFEETHDCGLSSEEWSQREWPEREM